MTEPEAPTPEERVLVRWLPSVLLDLAPGDAVFALRTPHRVMLQALPVSREALAALDRTAQERPYPALRVQLRAIEGGAAPEFLLRQLGQHDVHRFRPSGQELSRIEPGRRILPEGALLDHDDIEPAAQRRFRRAQTGQAAPGDQEIAGQALIGAGRWRKLPAFLVIG